MYLYRCIYRYIYINNIRLCLNEMEIIKKIYIYYFKNFEKKTDKLEINFNKT